MTHRTTGISRLRLGAIAWLGSIAIVVAILIASAPIAANASNNIGVIKPIPNIVAPAPVLAPANMSTVAVKSFAEPPGIGVAWSRAFVNSKAAEIAAPNDGTLNARTPDSLAAKDNIDVMVGIRAWSLAALANSSTTFDAAYGIRAWADNGAANGAVNVARGTAGNSFDPVSLGQPPSS